MSGTQILMADGSSKSIESVHIGDEIASYEFDSKKMVAKTVFLVDNPERENVVDILASNGTVISSTTDHPYWVKEKGWCSVDPGMTLSHYKIFLENDIRVQKLECGDELLAAQPLESEANGTGLPMNETLLVEEISVRAPASTPLWIIRVGNYGKDWRQAKVLHEAARLSGNYSTYYSEMEQVHSHESNPNDHNFFANGVLVHNK